MTDELVLPNLCSVIRNGSDDAGLTNAFVLRLMVAGTASDLNQECLNYQRIALAAVRHRLTRPNAGASEAIIGAILLLASVEVRYAILRRRQS